MKTTKYLFCILFFLLNGCDKWCEVPVRWSKFADNPVMLPGSSTSWDQETVFAGSVIYHGNKYHMWYTGGSTVDYNYHWRIGHATSDDGITWTKDPANPVLDKGLPGSWEDYYVFSPKVMVINNTFHMWYAGKKNKFADGNAQIGHATSSDGTTWAKDANNPVLRLGAAGTWDNSFITTGEVLFDGTKYHMWYTGNDTIKYAVKIGHATSTDALTWTKDQANPVLVADGTGSWESRRVENPTVLFDGSEYHMWYSGGSGLFRWKIGHATSSDGVNWTKDSGNPVLSTGNSGDWDSGSVACMSVILDNSGERYKMWYFGSKIGIATCIGYAERKSD